MMIRPRIIPTLLIEEGMLVKTTRFKNPNYLGDPLNAIKIFNEKEVDELAIMNIGLSKRGGEIDFELLEKMASEAFMPLSYGGGIRTLEDAKTIFSIGFEKIIINSLLIENGHIIEQIAEYFGSQSVIASIDYRKTIWGKRCYIKSGRVVTGYEPKELAVLAERKGVGEILLYSISNEGTGRGYDIETIRNVSENVSIPVIACGGANGLESIKAALDNGKADATAAGSMFVYYGKKKGILINFPSEEAFFKAGIYKKEERSYQ